MDLLPREKLVKLGVDKLTDEELLAIMLGTGIKGESVFELSKRLVDKYGLDRLFKMNYNELSKINGIKLSKATKLLASFEITRRIIAHTTKDEILKESKDLFNHVKGKYLYLDYEILTVIYVDNRLRIMDELEFSDKRYDYLSFPLKEIIKKALKINAFGIFLVHNHPAGNISPSRSDIESTEKLLNISNDLGIKLLDHIIISKNQYFSILDGN